MGFIGIMEKKMETRIQDETAWAFVVWDFDSRCREYGSMAQAVRLQNSGISVQLLKLPDENMDLRLRVWG